MKHWRITLNGVVQGVGFRPFVYKLARRYGLKGNVLNSSEGVSIELEGKPESLDLFMTSMHSELPPLARIDSVEIDTLPPVNYKTFEILYSQESDHKSALVSPDISLCDACLKEMQDPQNRRYRYPFINCTNCGPRYSIIKSIPYDRVSTSMNVFTMCHECKAEYEDPYDRRYHAEPISCYACGPELIFTNMKQEVTGKGEHAITLAAEAITEGKIVAVKGLGGFHLMCDATNEAAVQRLRTRKRRPSKPLAVMVENLDAVMAEAAPTEAEKVLISSKERPIVLMNKCSSCSLISSVSPGNRAVGLFLAYTPLHHLLFKALKRPLVATSANLSDEPILRSAEMVVEKLKNVVDVVLDHDREIVNAADDSVMQIVDGKKMTLRMARGFAPKSMRLPFKIDKKILAVGANQKNSIALAFGETLILSPHIGDLDSIEAFEYFERTIETFKRFYDFEPDIIICDKHPDYATTKLAYQLKSDQRESSGGKNSELIIMEVQHHYAHLLACMAEHSIVEPILGFAFDGTGYGDDSSIWGGEVMAADIKKYERVAGLKPFRLLGGDKAVKEPRRVALSLLFDSYTLDEIMALDLPTLREFTEQEITVLHQAWSKGVNSPLTSSMGRVFDAVASLADIVHYLSYEGESGLMMDAFVDETIEEIFPFTIYEGEIDISMMIKAMVAIDDKAVIVSMFLNTVVAIIFRIAKEYPDLPLAFSGGVFQNRVLVEKVQKRCMQESRVFYFQNDTPINDGGIALGQVWYGIHQEK